jgi:hypothetical protein
LLTRNKKLRETPNSKLAHGLVWRFFEEHELFRIVAFDNGVFDPDGWSLSARPFESYERDQRDEESNFCFVHGVGAPFAWKIAESDTVPGRYRITFVNSGRDLAAHRVYATDVRDPLDGTSTYAWFTRTKTLAGRYSEHQTRRQLAQRF